MDCLLDGNFFVVRHGAMELPVGRIVFAVVKSFYQILQNECSRSFNPRLWLGCTSTVQLKKKAIDGFHK